MWTIGVDRAEELIDEAQRRHSGLADCGFLLMDVKPDDVQRLPSFDVVLLLSVHHHWLRAYGPEQTEGMLRGLAEKTGRAMIFEAPSRRVRYGDHAPDFVDNDEVSVNVYLRSYLTRDAGRPLQQDRASRQGSVRRRTRALPMVLRPLR